MGVSNALFFLILIQHFCWPSPIYCSILTSDSFDTFVVAVKFENRQSVLCDTPAMVKGMMNYPAAKC